MNNKIEQIPTEASEIHMTVDEWILEKWDTNEITGEQYLFEVLIGGDNKKTVKYTTPEELSNFLLSKSLIKE